MSSGLGEISQTDQTREDAGADCKSCFSEPRFPQMSIYLVELEESNEMRYKKHLEHSRYTSS